MKSCTKKVFIVAVVAIFALMLNSCIDPSKNDSDQSIKAPFSDAGFNAGTYTRGAESDPGTMTVVISAQSATLTCPAGYEVPKGFSGAPGGFNSGGQYNLLAKASSSGLARYLVLSVFPPDTSSSRGAFADVNGTAAGPLEFNSDSIEFVCAATTDSAGALSVTFETNDFN